MTIQEAKEFIIYKTKDGRFFYRVLRDGRAEYAVGPHRICFFDRRTNLPVVLRLPDKLDSFEVAGIGPETFGKFWPLHHIVIEEGISYIGRRAFSGCRILEILEIPRSVTRMDDEIFWEDSDPYDLTLVVEKHSYAYEYAQKHGLYHTCSDYIDGNFHYRLDKDGNASVFRYLGKRAAHVRIPERLNGHLVTGIANDAFEKHEEIERITMPRYITRIGSGAFAGCTGLKKIDFPACLKQIGYSSFEECQKLRAVVLPANTSEIGRYAFEACTELEYVRIPGKVKRIEERLFAGCESLRVVELQDGVEEIMEDAFYGCTELKYALLPKSVKKMENCAFERGCSTVVVAEKYSYAETAAVYNEMKYMCMSKYRKERKKKTEEEEWNPFAWW